MGPNDGLCPRCGELEPEKARPTFCGPSEVFVSQFHLNGRPIELIEVGLGLKLSPGNGGVGSRVIKAGCNLQCTQDNHFNQLKDVGTSLPSPERSLSFNSTATLTTTVGCYQVNSMARSFVG